MTIPVRQRTPRKDKRGGPLSRAQLRSLQDGYCHIEGEDELWTDAEHRRAAWEGHREELLAAAPVGERPHAWWRYEAPSRPLCICDVTSPYVMWHETDAGALRRLGLLTEEEARLLAAGELVEWKEELEQWRRPSTAKHCDVYMQTDGPLPDPRHPERREWIQTRGAPLGELRKNRRLWNATCATCREQLPDFPTRRDGAVALAEHYRRQHHDK